MENGGTKITVWKPNEILEFHDPSKYAVVILNRNILQDPLYIAHLWTKAQVKVTVDGGTDRWLKFLRENEKILQSYNLCAPDLITGDFDSVKEETLLHFKNKGSQIIETPDQDETDFTKALKELTKYCNDRGVNINSIIVVCHSAGRMDQIMANINTLHRYKKFTAHLNQPSLYLFAKDSLSWMLDAGYHTIHIPDLLRKSTNSWCSLVPIGEKCESITTSGLKWNLKNGSMSFGEMVSTSNTYDGSDVVNIKISNPILWSMKVTPRINIVSRSEESFRVFYSEPYISS